MDFLVPTQNIIGINFSNYTLQIRKEDKSEVEQNIRDALESICTPDDVERELRAALTTLNLDTKEDNP